MFKREIEKRRTFAIISHPDAGKTTLTEKLLLFGGAIQLAGSVKAKRSKKFATSDWMELEKQRGISVTSSVMKFPYRSHEINLIDTPGHEDFSEDTYRTLTAVDSALMLIDCANGVERQTKKLFEVCRNRNTPIITFINKMDRDGRDPFDLLSEIEDTLGIKTYPITWPIGQGADFQGVYDRQTSSFLSYERTSQHQQQKAQLTTRVPLHSPTLRNLIGLEPHKQLLQDLELLEGAGESFSHDLYLKGELAPVLFGSAINNFGVETLLDYLVSIAPCPGLALTTERPVEATEDKFSAFIFKIQANMDPSHRDRVAFMRICSGRFERGMKAYQVRSKKFMRLGRPTQFMAQDRSLVDEAFAGDIVGIHDPSIFKIGDSLSEGENLTFTGIPLFAPEHFVRIQLKDPLKSKQLNKALDQLSEEGAVQVFRPAESNDLYLGVVGVLQIDVVRYRIEAEYKVSVDTIALPFTAARWIEGDEKDVQKLITEQTRIICYDHRQNPAILLDHEWRLKYHQDRHPRVQFKSHQEAL